MSNSVESFHTFGTDEVVQTEYTDQLNKIRQTFASGTISSQTTFLFKEAINIEQTSTTDTCDASQPLNHYA